MPARPLGRERAMQPAGLAASLTVKIFVRAKEKKMPFKTRMLSHNQLSIKRPLCSHLTCSGPSGEWIEELTEKPRHVSVHVLSPTTALTSWTSSQENYNGTIVSVVSLTCQKQKESQRLEKQYCTQVKERNHWQARSLTDCSPASWAMRGGHCEKLRSGLRGAS